jgi:hypothetical protein
LLAHRSTRNARTLGETNQLHLAGPQRTMAVSPLGCPLVPPLRLPSLVTPKVDSPNAHI